MKKKKEVSAQGILDNLLFNKETNNHIQNLIKSLDPDKIKSILRMIEVDEDGWLNLKIDLRIRK